MQEPAVRYLGRTYENDGVLWMSNPATGLEFLFSGQNLTLTFLRSDTTCDPVSAPHVVVFINGVRTADFLVCRSRESVCIYDRAAGALEEPACVTVLKASEGCESSLGICLEAETTDAGAVMTATEPKAKLIEFVGDSITCGYGVNGVLGDMFSTQNEDATKAYAYLAARELDCDYSMVAMSGHGVISGYTEGNEPVTSQLVMPYYEKLGQCYTEDEAFSPQKTSWDFKRTADILVVNLGTNDSSYCREIPERRQAYADAYVRMLYVLRAKNPHAKIWCTLGVMDQTVYDSMTEAVARYQSETKDRAVYTLKFDLQRPEDGFAVDWHPTATTQEKAAKRLVNELKGHVCSQSE